MDAVINYQFVFENTGFSTLVINEVSSGCDCLTLELADQKTEYAPGETGAVNLIFSPTHTGAQTAAIAVKSNAVPNPFAKLEVWARVK